MMNTNDDIDKLRNELDSAKRRIAELESLKSFSVKKTSIERSSHIELEWGLLYNAISHPIAILDSEQNIISVNQALREKLGYNDKDFSNLKCWEIFHSNDIATPPHLCPFSKVKESSSEKTTEMVMEALNGTYLVTCTPIYDANGNLDKVIHIATDISERKKQEEELKQNEAKLRIITENIVDIIWQTTPNFVFTYIAGGLEKTLGFKPEEVIGKTLFEMMEASSRAKLLEELAKIESIPHEQRINEQRRYELAFNKKDGGVVWCEIMPSFLLSESGHLLGFQGITRDITDRKRIELAIIESEKQLFQIIDFLPDPTFAIDLQGRVIAWNRAIEQMTGVGKDQIIGKGDYAYSIAVYGESRPMLIDIALSDSHEYEDLYDYVKRKDDTIFAEAYDAMFNQGKGAHIWGKATALKDNEGRIVGAIESFRDISDIRNTENELERSKIELSNAISMLRLVLDSAPVHIFWKDKNLTFRGCNSKFAKDYGFDNTEDIIGKSDYDICEQEAADYYRNLDFEILQSGLPKLNIEEPPNRVSSNGRWIKTSRVPLKDNNGDIIGVLAIHEDIHSTKESQIAFEKTAERLKLVFEVTSDGVWDWNVATGETFFSDRYYSMLGYDKTDFTQSYLSWESLLHPEDKNNAVKAVENHINNRDEGFNIEFRLRTKAGDYKWIHGRGRVIERDSLGNPIRMVGTHVDITNRKLAESRVFALNEELKSLNAELETRVEARTLELRRALRSLEDSNDELKQMNEQAAIDAEHITNLNHELIQSEQELKRVMAAKDKFFAVIAHELKTPFSGFLLLSDMMAKDFDELSVNDMKKMSQTINTSASSLYNLLESLLQWSRMQLGEVPFNSEKLDLNEIATNINYIFKNQAKDKEIELINKVPKGTIVQCDRNMITSVLRNLVSNSVKFTDKDGYVEIGIYSVRENEQEVVVYVKDSGVGIPAEALNKLFNIESHYSTKGTRKEAGSGLGLTLCKEFIDKHNCRISIDSKEGEGTVVYFSLHM